MLCREGNPVVDPGVVARTTPDVAIDSRDNGLEYDDIGLDIEVDGRPISDDIREGKLVAVVRSAREKTDTRWTEPGRVSVGEEADVVLFPAAKLAKSPNEGRFSASRL